MKKASLLSVALLVCATALLPVAVGAFSDPPSVGATAPSFKLPTNAGTTVQLSDFKGKWVVLYFYPKDGTKGCTIEAHNFQRDLDKYKKLNAEIVGVSVDTVDSHKKFCSDEALTFTLLSDTEHSVSDQYGSLADYNGQKFSSRNTFIVNPEGKVAKVFLKVNPTVHSDEVLAALAELQK